MTERIVVIGGGTSGTIVANRLHKMRDGKASITVIDRDDRHMYQPQLLSVAFGLAQPEDSTRSRRAQLHRGIDFRECSVERVNIDEQRVYIGAGKSIEYDVLVVATGARLVPEETEGLLGSGWMERMFTFYERAGALALRDKLRAFKRGTVVLNVVDMPIKCSVAPLEFCFLADWFFQKRGVRQDINIKYVVPMDGVFTKPLASQRFGNLLEEKGVSIVTGFSTGSVDGEAGKLFSWDEREVDFDLLVTIPLHAGSKFVNASPKLGDESGFVMVDPQTLQSVSVPNVFGIGDGTNLPTAKTGSAAHYQSDTLVTNVCRFLDRKPLEKSFDGHSTCFIETGFNKASLIDFNYDHEPYPGVYPFPAVGPMSLMKESRRNHLGKRSFEWMYWNLLLPGRGMPGVPHHLTLAGKQVPAGAGKGK
ncbi:MAG: oxidoreductase [Pseudonocardia sp. SCN 72-51]|nr:MAG: oxidoreductase [Pseudonocardia sp. SCN 72-51]